MLDATLKTEYVVGTNLGGGLASADWRYLLPRLRFDSVLCLDAPPLTSIPVLKSLGQFVFVVSTERSKLLEIQRECRKQDIRSICGILVRDYASLPFNHQSIDLIFVKPHKGKSSLGPLVCSEIRRLLKTEGVVYYDAKTKSEASLARNGSAAVQSYWVTPFSGRIRTAVPLNDRAITDYFFAKVLYGRSPKKRALSRVSRALNAAHLLNKVTPRRAHIVHCDRQDGRVGLPPKYLRTLAEKSGFELSDYRFGLSTRGPGNSNKAIFYLFRKSETKPEIVVKMTRAPEFNYRLENEYRVMSLLKNRQWVSSHSVPDPLFLDYHNELAVLGMRAVEGDPFRVRTEAKDNCPIAKDALNWIVQLGANSAVGNTASAIDVAMTLRELFERFQAIYRLPAKYSDFLQEQIALVEASGAQVPLVLQHGDPGTWNMLVSRADKVIVIDWESGEPAGMPLWDLFYFFRTYALWVSRQQGSRDSLQNFADQFLQPTRLAETLREFTARYCGATALDSSLIKPLFYTCWMHRALKEAMRLTNETLQSGNFVSLLRMLIDQHDAEMLTQLFSLNVSNKFEPFGHATDQEAIALKNGRENE